VVTRKFIRSPVEVAMLELNTLFSQIKNMQERVDALRGYL